MSLPEHKAGLPEPDGGALLGVPEDSGVEGSALAVGTSVGVPIAEPVEVVALGPGAIEEAWPDDEGRSVTRAWPQAASAIRSAASRIGRDQRPSGRSRPGALDRRRFTAGS